MKLLESFRFPYPVLTETSGDYVTDEIALQIQIDERPTSGELKIAFELRVDSASLRARIDAGNAKCFMSVVCRESFYNTFIELGSLSGEVHIPPGNLFGRVQVRAVVASTSTSVLEAFGLQEDYQSTKFQLPEGAVIGWTEQQYFSVGMDKLAPMESVFKLARKDDLSEGTFAVSYEDDYITIHAPEKLLTTIHAMRGISKAKAIALNAIYMPALMQVLESFRFGDESEGRRWHRVLLAKADFLALDLQRVAPLDAAQRLLRAPASRLSSIVEKGL